MRGHLYKQLKEKGFGEYDIKNRTNTFLELCTKFDNILEKKISL